MVDTKKCHAGARFSSQQAVLPEAWIRPDAISRALNGGAKAYVLKDISADDLISCIRNVLAGKTYIAPAAAAKLAEGVTRVQLTRREMATLRLLADGKASKEIASALDISERTVKTPTLRISSRSSE